MPEPQPTGLDWDIAARLRNHHAFDAIISMPSLGVVLAAGFLGATGGDTR
ncbi:hypothetical protein [Streptomyces sp. NPDC091217]